MSREDNRRARCRWTKSDYLPESTHQHSTHPFGGRKLVTSSRDRDRDRDRDRGFSDTKDSSVHHIQRGSVERKSGATAGHSRFSPTDNNGASRSYQHDDPGQNQSRFRRTKSPVDEDESWNYAKGAKLLEQRRKSSLDSKFRPIDDSVNAMNTKAKTHGAGQVSTEASPRTNPDNQNHGFKNTSDTDEQQKCQKGRTYYTIRNRSLKNISPNPSSSEGTDSQSPRYRTSPSPISPNNSYLQKNTDTHTNGGSDTKTTNRVKDTTNKLQGNNNQSHAAVVPQGFPTRSHHRRSSHRLIDHLEMKESYHSSNHQIVPQHERKDGHKSPIYPVKINETKTKQRSSSPNPKWTPSSRTGKNTPNNSHYNYYSPEKKYTRNSPYQDDSAYNVQINANRTPTDDDKTSSESDQNSDMVQLESGSSADKCTSGTVDTAPSSSSFCRCDCGSNADRDHNKYVHPNEECHRMEQTIDKDKGFKQFTMAATDTDRRESRDFSKMRQQADKDSCVSWTYDCPEKVDSTMRDCDRCHQKFSLVDHMNNIRRQNRPETNSTNQPGESRVKQLASNPGSPHTSPREKPLEPNGMHAKSSKDTAPTPNFKVNREENKYAAAMSNQNNRSPSVSPPIEPSGQHSDFPTFPKQPTPQQSKPVTERQRKQSRKEIFNQYSSDTTPSPWHSSMPSNVTDTDVMRAHDLSNQSMSSAREKASHSPKDKSPFEFHTHNLKHNLQEQKRQQNYDRCLRQEQQSLSSSNEERFSQPAFHLPTGHPSHHHDQTQLQTRSTPNTHSNVRHIRSGSNNTSLSQAQSSGRHSGIDYNRTSHNFAHRPHQHQDNRQSPISINQYSTGSEDSENENLSSVSNSNLQKTSDSVSNSSQPCFTHIDKNDSRRSQSSERFYEMIQAVKKRLQSRMSRSEPDTDTNSSNIAVNSSSFLADYIVSLWENQWLCDVQVTVGGSELLAHKLILAAFSDVFCPNDPHPPPSVSFAIPDSTYEAVEQIFRYMYTGNMDLSDEILDAVLKAALYMGVSEVVCLVQDIMRCADTNNIEMYMSISRSNTVQYDFSKTPAIQQHMKELLGSGFYETLTSDEMETMLNDPDVEVESEEVTLRAVLEWVNVQPYEIQGTELARLLRKITMESIPPNNLSEIMNEYSFLFSLPEVTEIMLGVFQYHALHCKTSEMWYNMPRPSVTNKAHSTVSRSSGPKYSEAGASGVFYGKPSATGSIARSSRHSSMSQRRDSYDGSPSRLPSHAASQQYDERPRSTLMSAGGGRSSGRRSSSKTPATILETAAERCRRMVGMSELKTMDLLSQFDGGQRSPEMKHRRHSDRRASVNSTGSANHHHHHRHSGDCCSCNSCLVNQPDCKVRFCLNNSHEKHPVQEDTKPEKKMKRGTLSKKDLCRSQNNNNSVSQSLVVPPLNFHNNDILTNDIIYHVHECEHIDGEFRNSDNQMSQSTTSDLKGRLGENSRMDSFRDECSNNATPNNTTHSLVNSDEIKEFDPIRSLSEIKTTQYGDEAEGGSKDLPEQNACNSTFEIDEAGCPFTTSTSTSIDRNRFTIGDSYDHDISSISSRNRQGFCHELDNINIPTDSRLMFRGTNTPNHVVRFTRSITPTRLELRNRDTLEMSDSIRTSRSLSFLGHDDDTSAFQSYNP